MPKVDLTDAIFSFSKLKTYETCPYSWYEIYVNKVERLQNAFSQYGTLMHSILERYVLGKTGKETGLETWELETILQDEYNNFVTERFPANKYCDLSVKYRESAEGFLQNVDSCEVVEGIENGRLKILGVEHEFIYDIKVDEQIFKYRGFIDLILLDTDDDKIIIVDHKSKSIKTNVKGNPVEKDIRDAYLQMSTYALSVKNDFGQYPKEIWINAFKIQSVFKKEFSLEMAHESLEWCKEMIRKIRDEKHYSKNPDSFFCTQLCSCRLSCGKFITFDKSGVMLNGQPESQTERISQERATEKTFFGEGKEEDFVVKPFSWDDDEEFDV